MRFPCTLGIEDKKVTDFLFCFVFVFQSIHRNVIGTAMLLLQFE